MDVKDFLGNIIKEGDQIVWPNRQGSSMWMNKGWVRSIGTIVTSKPGKYELDNDGNTIFYPGVPYHKPILIVDRFQGNGTATKKVEIYRTNRVVALGRWENFQPMKEPCEFRETWLDRVMKWIRG